MESTEKVGGRLCSSTVIPLSRKGLNSEISAMCVPVSSELNFDSKDSLSLRQMNEVFVSQYRSSAMTNESATFEDVLRISELMGLNRSSQILIFR